MIHSVETCSLARNNVMLALFSYVTENQNNFEFALALSAAMLTVAERNGIGRDSSRSQFLRSLFPEAIRNVSIMSKVLSPFNRGI